MSWAIRATFVAPTVVNGHSPDNAHLEMWVVMTRPQCGGLQEGLGTGVRLPTCPEARWRGRRELDRFGSDQGRSTDGPEKSVGVRGKRRPGPSSRVGVGTLGVCSFKQNSRGRSGLQEPKEPRRRRHSVLERSNGAEWVQSSRKVRDV